MSGDTDILTTEEQVIIKKSKILALPIRNSYTFLELINKAYKVSSYTVEYGRPNPPNYKAWIQEPLEELIGHTNANTGSFTVKNKEGLQTESLEEISRSAAVMDSMVQAKVHDDEFDTWGTTIKMQRDAEDLYVDIPEIDISNRSESAAKSILKKFKSIAPTNNEE
jgi:hypothetical protein